MHLRRALPCLAVVVQDKLIDPGSVTRVFKITKFIGMLVTGLLGERFSPYRLLGLGWPWAWAGLGLGTATGGCWVSALPGCWGLRWA